MFIRGLYTIFRNEKDSADQCRDQESTDGCREDPDNTVLNRAVVTEYGIQDDAGEAA